MYPLHASDSPTHPRYDSFSKDPCTQLLIDSVKVKSIDPGDRLRSESESRSVMSDSLLPHRLHSPWNSPGQNTRVDSLSLLQGNHPNPGIEPGSPALQADTLPTEYQGSPTCPESCVKVLFHCIYIYLNLKMSVTSIVSWK